MKFLLVSKFGEGANLLYRIMQEDNEVLLHITEKDYKDAWDGLLPKSNNLYSVDADTVVVFDTVGHGGIADKFKRRGNPVCCGSSEADKLEEDRSYGIEVMHEYGIKTSETIEFNDVEKAISFLSEDQGRYVFKPDGEACKYTYVSKGADDLIYYLQSIKSFAKIGQFELQEFVDGIEVSCEGWFDGERFLRPFNRTLEVKKFLDKDLGPATGCSGNIVWPCDEDNIIENSILRIEDYLSGKYIGPIDLNCIIRDDEIFGLEWTPRFGYDAMPALINLLQDDLGKFFSDLARQQLNEIAIKDALSANVRLSIPPYPIEKSKQDKIENAPPFPIQGIEESDLHESYFYEVKLQDNQLVTSCYGTVGTIGSVGDSFDIFDDIYTKLEEINIPDKQYRTDIKSVLQERYKKLVEVKVDG